MGDEHRTQDVGNNKPESRKFWNVKKNATWCAVGDSITHGGDYTKYIYLFYATRFPQDRFSYYNGGIGGDTAHGTLTRMDYDVLAHKPTMATVMLGMNDVWCENNNYIKKGDYIKNVEKIIDLLENQDCSVILFTPSIYDDTAKSPIALDPLRNGLSKYADDVVALAEKRKIPVVDAHSFMKDFTGKMQVSDSEFSLIGVDRVHPKESGHLMMAYLFLKNQVKTSVVSEFHFDAKSDKILLQNHCEISNLKKSDGKISFSMLEYALPFPLDGLDKQILGLLPFVSELDREIFQITGLKDKKYDLLIDNIPVGSFDSREFAAGINLATISNTPQNNQAKHVAALNQERHSLTSDQRFIEMIEYGVLKKHFPTGDAVAPLADIETFLAGIQDSGGRQSQRDMFEKQYLAHKAREKASDERIHALIEQIWKENKPVSHEYHLVEK
jgi:lysophospholipase L1-like esterase